MWILKSLLEDYRSFALIVPSFIDNKAKQREFLRALYDDEGCVALRIFRKTGEIKRNLTLSSNSLKFIEEIKIILERSFSIQSNKISRYVKKWNNKEFVNYVLSITGKDNFEKFQEHIGFTHPDKTKKLYSMIHSYKRK